MTFVLLPEEEKTTENIPQKEPSFIQKSGEFAKEAIRPVVRTASNLTALGLGVGGDVAKLVNDWVAGPIASTITGQKSIPYEETHIGKLLPTSQQHKQALQSIAPDYLKPRGPIEDFEDTVLEDTALLFSPGKSKIPFAKTATKASKLLRAFLTSTGANLAGESVKDLSGGDETKATATKMGSLFLLSLINRPKAGQMVSKLYKEAESAIPENASVNAERMKDSLTLLKEKMSKGTGAPSEKFVIDEIDAVLSKIKDGKIPVDEAWASKRSLNEKLQKHLYETPEKAAQQRARKLSTKIQSELKQSLDDYSKINPKFGKNFKEAEQAFGTIAQSNFMSRFIRNNLKYSPVTSGLIHLFSGPIGSTAATAIAPYQVAKLGYRISNSPVLAKYYGNVLKAVVAEDSNALNKSLQRLDNEMQKHEKGDTFSLID